MGFWKAVGRQLGAVYPEDEAQCRYSYRGERCPVIVPPNSGIRTGLSAFCSDEHARLDQEDAPM